MKQTKSDTNDFTLAELEHAKKIAARVVAMYGDIYLPIFKRLYDEVEKKKTALDMKSLALKVAAE